ncbi:MAG: hypothetical protein QGG42_12960 [Phycisphaerae bacterium]|jgi:hypothetical protein|nr:hypothetical protein [Phycisphaerae bacterium]
MMVHRILPPLLILWIVIAPTGRARAESTDIPSGPGVVEFVDGLKTDCEILFKHPNCDRLVVRSSSAGTVQSFAIAAVHQVAAGGKSVTVNRRRDLTAAEKATRKTNGLWGDHAGPRRIGRYAKQKWERKPLIVWANPGKIGEFDAPANWLDETGKPLKTSPWKKDSIDRQPAGKRRRKAGPAKGLLDGDILLPSSDTKYSVLQPGNRDHLGAFRMRHLTIESRASYNVRYAIQGNLWMKDGSMIGRGTQTGGFGSGDLGWNTFARFCGRRWINQKSAKRKRPGANGESEWISISHWVAIDTGASGSLEIIGKSGGPSDRLTLRRGTLIVSEDSYIGNGNRGSYYGMPGTTTILLDGAGVGCRHKIICRGRSTYGIAGTLMCGTPQRPLTRDLKIECCLYNIEGLSPDPQLGQRTHGASFVLGATGKMIVHSKDPKTARVVFCPIPAGNPVSQYMIAPRAKNRPTPTGITAVFVGETTFDGVVFEGVCKGGVIVDPKARKAWKNVSFGKNQAPGDGIFRPFPPNSE